MSRGFEIKDNIISIKKDCKICSHIKVCSFHKKTAELFKTNEFYGMAKWAEWHNALETFEQHTRCQHFKIGFFIPVDCSVGMNIDSAIISEICDIERKRAGFSSCYSYRAGDEEFTYISKDDSKKVVKISELLSKYKFVSIK